jgi:hypothetical protein
MIVRESLDFEREGSPLKRLNIGILTWDKLKPGDILQNKRRIYPVMARLFFSPNEDTAEDINAGKYWIIKEIVQQNKSLDGREYIEMELVWAGIFRHALSMAERIKQPGNLVSKNLPKSYTANKSVEEWDDWFKIIQPKEYDLEESINFERGIDPKVSMDIGNKWTRIKVGDIIECSRPTIIRESNNMEFLEFEDYTEGEYLGDRDYVFEIGNVAYIKTIVDFGVEGLRISIIPFETEKEARELKNLALYSAIKGTAPISKWAKFFKVL